MMSIPHFKVLAVVALALVVALLLRALRIRDKLASSRIDIDDLLIDQLTGRISKPAAVLWATWAPATWLIVYWALQGKLSDTAFATYLAVFATPAIVKIFKDPPAGGTPPIVQAKDGA